MSLFTLENNKVVVQPPFRLIPEFKDILDRDDSEHKANALQELAFVFFVADYKSPYRANYDEAVLYEKTWYSLFKTKYKKDKLILKAIEAYEELQDVPSMKYLKRARIATDKLTSHLQSIDYDKKDISGKPLYDGAKIARTLTSISKIVKDLKDTETMVKMEIEQGGTLRGGRKKGNREDPN